ncbi:putative E3 ubiquitin-protein ligase LIN [Triticum aestivum]|uniref:putative E3 ubiquitin-protein ligase LIN n=1 Tax=Triticum aestivum TaxID=4565 RepID=UPI0008439D51|nr:putative E3 ubiquitin-protein ligase LIN [Triticum aestivum]
MEPPGSGAEPVEDDHIQEPARGRSKSNASSNGPPSAAVPPPPRATPLHLDRPRREHAGGGADGSSSVAAGGDRKGKGTLPPKVIPSPPSSAGSSSSSTRSLDYAAALRGGALGGGESSSAEGGSKARVTRSDPGAAETRGVPDAAAHPFDPKLVSRQRLAAVDKENRRWEHQFNSLRAEEAMQRKEQSLDQSYRQWFDSEKKRGYSNGSSSSATGVNRKGKGMLPLKAIPSPPSSAGSSSSSTHSLDYTAALRAGAFGGWELSSAAGGSKARVTWGDPLAAEMREVTNAAAHPFDPKMVSRQRWLVKEQAAVDKEKSRREQQFNSLRAEEAMHRKEQWFDSPKNGARSNEVPVKWSYNNDDEIPYPLYAEFCGDYSSSSPRREWSDVRIVRRLRGLRWQERVAARTHFRELRDSWVAARRKPSSLFMSAMDQVRDGKAKEYSGGCAIPGYLTCPLSGELMIDPVTIATGKTFERHFLKGWFEKKGHICPLTNETVSSTIIRNDRIRGYLEEWNEVMEEE